MAKLRDNQVMIKGVIAFPSVFKKDQNDKYSIVVLFPKDDNATKEKVDSAIKAAIENGRDKVWKNGKAPSEMRKPIHDGDDKEYDGYAGNYYINAKANRKKPIVDRHKVAIEDEEEIYGGCICNVVISFAAYDQSGNKGIGAYLDGLQKIKDGKRFGAGDFNGFEDLGDDEDEEDIFGDED